MTTIFSLHFNTKLLSNNCGTFLSPLFLFLSNQYRVCRVSYRQFSTRDKRLSKGLFYIGLGSGDIFLHRCKKMSSEPNPIDRYPTSEQLAPPTSEQYQVSARLVEANEQRNAGSLVSKRAVIP